MIIPINGDTSKLEIKKNVDIVLKLKAMMGNIINWADIHTIIVSFIILIILLSDLNLILSSIVLLNSTIPIVPK